MPFEKITAGKLSQAVTHQIEELILRGICARRTPPSERELAERMGVSRPSLREAIADLQEKGLLSSRAGAGIFVADVLGNAFSPRWYHYLANMMRRCLITLPFDVTWRVWRQNGQHVWDRHRFTGDPNHLR